MQSSLRNSWLPSGFWWLYKRWCCTEGVYGSHLLTHCQQDGDSWWLKGQKFYSRRQISRLPAQCHRGVEDQTYQGHKTECDPALQVKASHGSMGQIHGFWQVREIEPTLVLLCPTSSAWLSRCWANTLDQWIRLSSARYFSISFKQAIKSLTVFREVIQGTGTTRSYLAWI